MKITTLFRHKRRAATPRQGLSRNGQSTVEFAMMLPLLALLLAIVVDGGLAINSWIRVNTAARDGARFALNNGRPPAIGDLVLRKLNGLGASDLDVFIVKGYTDNAGHLPNNPNPDDPQWSVVHWVDNGWNVNLKVTPADIEQKLDRYGAASQKVSFTIVEVHYMYSTFLGKIINQSQIPMSSYALMQTDQ